MSVKSKKMRKAARTAAMSALIVSAIVGTSVLASAATTDNSSVISSGTVSTSAGGNASALKVTGGVLYVDSVYKTNLNTGDVKHFNGANALISGGSVVVGKKADGTAATSATMTVDNMTITNGGTVAVVNGTTLTAVDDININGGKLELAGVAGTPASGSTVVAKNVNVNAGGTLAATQGTDNLVQTSVAVNLNNGTITVAKDAGLTIAKAGNAVSSDKGLLTVTEGGVLNSRGGTINAGLVVSNRNSAGEANFTAGTTTVDNLTVEAGGQSVISGNATVVSKQDVTITGSGSQLDMQGGTLRVLDPAGAVNVKSSGELLASAGVNTVDAKVNVTASGVVNVTGAASLTITKDLTVDGGSVAVAGTSANLILKGGLTTVGTNVIKLGDATNKGTLTAGFGAVTGTNVAANSIQMGAASASQLNGKLIVTDYTGANFDVVGTDQGKIIGKLTNGVLGDDYALNNVVIWGKELVKNGTTIKAEYNGIGGFTAGTNVVVTPATPGDTPAVTGGELFAPSVSTASGALTVGDGTALNAGTLTLVGVGMGDASNKTTNLTTLKLDTGNASVNNGATLVAGTLDMTNGNLDVLNAVATIGSLKATDGTLFVDPAIVSIGSIQDNDLKAVSLLTGSGSVVTLGGAAGWMAKPMADAGFAFNDTTKATLGIAATDTITIGSGVVAVDPNIVKDGASYKIGNDVVGQGTHGAFWAGNNTLTVIDAAGLAKDEAVFELTAADSKVVNIANGAKLHVANLTVNGLQIFSVDDGSAPTLKNGASGSYNPTDANAGWIGANFTQPDRMLTPSWNTTTGKLEATVNNASFALGMSSEFNDLMYGVWGSAMNNTNSYSAGIRLVSRAASTDYGLSALDAAKTIEGAAQLGAVAGVQGVTISAANSATSAVATRTSFAQPLLDKTKAVAMNVDSEGNVSLDSGLSAGNGMKNGLALWIMPLYQSNNVWGQKAGNFKSGYNSDLGGIAAGVDYTVNDMFRFGAALNIGAGYSESSGDFNSTDNSFNFWGVNLYGGWTMNNFGVTADVGYTGNYNKVEQDAPVSLGMSNFKSDINTSAWTAGLKAEYKLETSVMDIIPHIGVRYMGLNTEEYDVTGGGGTVFNVENDFQSIWTFPIGVTLSKNFETGSGWVFKPQMDLSVIPATGDVKAKSKSKIPGAPGSAEAKMQVVDYVTFDGGVGFDIGNENLNFGLNYNIQASEHRTAHGVFGTVRYEF